MWPLTNSQKLDTKLDLLDAVWGLLQMSHGLCLCGAGITTVNSCEYCGRREQLERAYNNYIADDDDTPTPIDTLDAYQDAALRTAARDFNAYGIDPKYKNDELLLRKLDQLIWSNGLTGEAGECADFLKKLHGHGHVYDSAARQHMGKELGDVLWYLAVLADSFGFDLSEIAQMNVDKLMKRYPNGFEIKRSIDRKNG